MFFCKCKGKSDNLLCFKNHAVINKYFYPKCFISLVLKKARVEIDILLACLLNLYMLYSLVLMWYSDFSDKNSCSCYFEGTPEISSKKWTLFVMFKTTKQWYYPPPPTKKVLKSYVYHCKGKIKLENYSNTNTNIWHFLRFLNSNMPASYFKIVQFLSYIYT